MNGTGGEIKAIPEILRMISSHIEKALFTCKESFLVYFHPLYLRSKTHFFPRKQSYRNESFFVLKPSTNFTPLVLVKLKSFLLNVGLKSTLATASSQPSLPLQQNRFCYTPASKLVLPK
ncbi:hypothetical protein [Brevibacillus laterosporus]|uniref:hypothetical protein n=1 Tax=Brevibacillus laterosporus TaxID=1465 RepID=UPI00265C9D79|nr:hypothetical protein [Brevibacillus laterosporus]